MDASWLVVLVSAGVLLALVLLVVACLDCRNKGPMVSIRQGSTSEEYIDRSTEFRVIHPSFGLSTIHSPSNHLSTQRNSPDPGRRPYPPSETESNPSYENPVNGPESLDNNPEGDYIIVLADNQNRPSTPCSDTLHDYENLEGTAGSKSSATASDEENDHDYQNVNPGISKLTINPPGLEFSSQGLTPESSVVSDSSDEDDYDDSGNYVNQPPITHS